MKKTLFTFCILMISSSLKAESFFIKPGAGFTLGSNPVQYTTSVGGGVEYSDGFSFFPSIEVNLLDGSTTLQVITLNAEYKVLKFNFLKPYFFAGIGFDYFKNTIGHGFQVGLGLEFEINRRFDLFFETKYFDAGNYWWLFLTNPQYSYWALPIISGGLKFNL